MRRMVRLKRSLCLFFVFRLRFIDYFLISPLSTVKYGIFEILITIHCPSTVRKNQNVQISSTKVHSDILFF